MSKIVSLQLLRGFAATSVAGFHLQAAALAEGGEPGLFALFAGGEIGVDVFFVLSGFIIFYVAKNRPDLTPGAFLRARFWRILPPYWAILSLYVLAALALMLVLGDSSKVPDVQSLIVSYLLLPYPDHVIVIAWTLSLELMFYLVFAATFFTGGTRRLVLAMVIWVVLSQLFAQLAEGQPLWLVFPLHSAVLEFLFGILIGIYVCAVPLAQRRLHIPALILGGCGVLAYLVVGQIHIGPFGREIAAGVPSALLVYGVLGVRLGDLKRWETWGESSYILYLFHILYFSIAGRLVEIVTGINVYHSTLWMGALLLSVLAICYGATVWIERPYQRWYKRFL